MTDVMINHPRRQDRPLLVDPEEALEHWAALPPNPSPATIKDFVDEYFGEEGSDLIAATPADWSALPPKLASIENETLKNFSLALNNIWPSLVRTVTDDVVRQVSFMRNTRSLAHSRTRAHPTISLNGTVCFAEERTWWYQVAAFGNHTTGDSGQTVPYRSS